MARDRGVGGSLELTDLSRLIRETEGWGLLRAAVTKGESGTIDGAWGSAGPAAVAALAADIPAPLLVVVPGIADIEPWADDLTSFSGTGRPFFQLTKPGRRPPSGAG